MTAVETKERPILFSGPMIRAIREGRKTQTRRVIKDQPIEVAGEGPVELVGPARCWMRADLASEALGRQRFWTKLRCPYGRIGDRLWCRETWGEPWHHAQPPVFYRASSPNVENHPDFDGWRPSIHMPRWASRLTLEITGVRVERVQQISEADCYAEGIPEWQEPGQTFSPIVRFRELWDALNAKRGFGWSQNPFVWCISFKDVSDDPPGMLRHGRDGA